MKTLTPFTLPSLGIAVGATTPAVPIGTLAWSTTAASCLQFNGSTWQALAAGSGSGSSTLAGDSDVAITSPVAGNHLVYNGSQWANTAVSFVDLTSAQTIGGVKTFSSPPVLSGASITTATIPLAALAAAPVDLTTAQTIGGVKTFSSPPVFSGASMTAGTLAPAALSTAPVLVTGAQTIAGVKTFSSPPAMSGASITNATIPNAALVTTPVTSVGVSGNITSTGGATTPTIGMTSSPSFTGAVSFVGGASTTGLTISSDSTNGLYRSPGTHYFQNAAGSAYAPIVAGAITVNNSIVTGTGNLVYGGPQHNFENAALSAFTSCNASAFNIVSDTSLKTNVVALATGLETIMALKPVTYDWIADSSPGIGFIAQDVQTVLPIAVVSMPALGTSNPLLGLRGDAFTPFIVRAIQELSAQFTAYVTAHP